jgi:exodeoxyribonuclease VII large subunit
VGAALRDMLQILDRRNRGTGVVIAPVRMQGTGAAREIADAIRLLNEHSRRSGYVIDVIIVGRGGGSAEDLWAFNEEQVARSIFESKIPVVTAIGHETDYTIADFVADLRAPTPSAAAELVTAESAELLSRIGKLRNRLNRAMSHYLLVRRSELRHVIESPGFSNTASEVIALSAECRQLENRVGAAIRKIIFSVEARVNNLKARIEATDFRAALAIKTARLDALNEKLDRALQRSLEMQRHRVALLAGKLDLLSPLSVLGRGYALVKDEEGNLVSKAAAVKEGQNLNLRFEDGEVGVRAI